MSWASPQLPRGAAHTARACLRGAFVLMGLLALAAGPARAEAAGDGGTGAEEYGPAEEVADAPTVGASLDRTEATVGDILVLTVSAVGRAPVAQTVRLGEPLGLGKFEKVDLEQSDRDLGDGKFGRRFVLRIVSFEIGELEVPALPIEFVDGAGRRHRTTTAPIPVRVRSLVGEDPQAAPQPPRPPRSVVVEDQRLLQKIIWVGGGMSGLVVLALAARLWWRRRARRLAQAAVLAPAPVRPPDEIALARLAAVRARGQFALDRYRPFYFEVAEIVRAYLGARFSFEALELTTTELLTELERVGLPTLDEEIHRRVIGFLEASDLVKFASAPSDNAQALRALDEAEAIVRRLRATFVAPTPVAVRAAVKEAPGG